MGGLQQLIGQESLRPCGRVFISKEWIIIYMFLVLSLLFLQLHFHGTHFIWTCSGKLRSLDMSSPCTIRTMFLAVFFTANISSRGKQSKVISFPVDFELISMFPSSHVYSLTHVNIQEMNNMIFFCCLMEHITA